MPGRENQTVGSRLLRHEVWEEFGTEGESLPTLCLAGPRGDGCRSLLGSGARLVTTFEAGSHYEAMTIYYRLLGWGVYTTDQPWDDEPYPVDWHTQQ